jgi:TPR repeat protein
MRWLKRAANQGGAEAEFYLARAYQTGHGGLEKTDANKEAVIWYTQAARQGYKPAQDILKAADIRY